MENLKIFLPVNFFIDSVAKHDTRIKIGK